MDDFKANQEYINLLIDEAQKQKRHGYIGSIEHGQAQKILTKMELVMTSFEIIKNTKLAFPRAT